MITCDQKTLKFLQAVMAAAQEAELFNVKMEVGCWGVTTLQCDWRHGGKMQVVQTITEYLDNNDENQGENE